MNDIRRTKDQLIKELRALRRKTASLEKKLREKPVETPWQGTFDSLNDAVCILDQKGIILRCNRAAKTLFKKPFSRLIGKKCWGVVYGTSKIPVEGCSFARMLQTGQRESAEKQLKGRWFRITTDPIRDKNRQLTGAVYMLSDITEHRQAEETLRDSEKRFSTIFHFSPISIAITRLSDNQLIDVNEAWQEITGFTREEVIGHPATELNLWADPEERSRLMTALADQGLVRGFEVVIRRKSGNKIHLLFSAGLITIEGEQCMLSMVLDVTGRIQMERQLREAHWFAQSTIDALTDHICVMDSSGKILTVNRVWRAFAETNPPVPPDYCIGANYLEVCDSSHGPNSAEAAPFATGLRAVLRGEQETFTLEYPCDVPGGEERWFIARVSAFAEEGRPLAVVSHRNITERKRAEENLHRYRRRLSELASKIALIAEDERRRFADELHDLTGQNLALAKIKLSELRDSLSDKEIQDRLDELHQLIEEASASTRSLTFELSPPILYEIGFAAAAQWLGEQILRKYNIAFHFEDDKQTKPLSDEAKVLLFVSLRELIVNIGKHSKARNATVTLGKAGNMLHVSVTDDGIGFDASSLDFQIMKATSFGLFSTRERIERLGGRLEIASQPGKGTTVIMVVPLKK